MVVLASDDEYVVVAAAMNTGVVVGVGDVPVERGLHGTARAAQSDDVGPVRVLLRVNREAVIDGAVRRDDDGPAPDGVPVARDHARSLATLEALGMRAEDVAAARADGVRQSREIAERMELPLIRKARARVRRPSTTCSPTAA